MGHTLRSGTQNRLVTFQVTQKAKKNSHVATDIYIYIYTYCKPMYAVPMYDGDHPRIIRTCISVLLVAVSLVCELFDAKLQKW